jgi:hypothetical protein
MAAYSPFEEIDNQSGEALANLILNIINPATYEFLFVTPSQVLS